MSDPLRKVAIELMSTISRVLSGKDPRLQSETHEVELTLAEIAAIQAAAAALTTFHQEVSYEISEEIVNVTQKLNRACGVPESPLFGGSMEPGNLFH